MLTSIEEETLKPKKIGCLSDALGEANITAISSMPLPARPSSAMLTDFDKELYNESSNLMRLVRSEAQTPESNQSTVDENESIDHSMLDDDDNKNSSLQDSPPSIISMTTGRPARSRNPSMSQSNGDVFSKRNCGSYRSLDRLSRGPGRVSVWSEKITKQIPPPFRGSISSQLMCTACNYKSVSYLLGIISLNNTRVVSRSFESINLIALLWICPSKRDKHFWASDNCLVIMSLLKILSMWNASRATRLRITQKPWHSRNCRHA